MYLDFAPMEGITGAAFRRVHRTYFKGVDRYYTPFLSPTKEHIFTPREQREFYPEYNRQIPVIPQILTKVSEDFLWAAGQLHAMGYEEVNLNLGCPSGTVTAKGKGCGMLADREALRRFLDEIYEKSPCPVSIKTRLGMEDPADFFEILEIYNQYPVAELIVHPRVRKDFYRHPVRHEIFEQAMSSCKMPVSFNGGIVTVEDFEECAEKYPQVKAIMIGQGLVSDPFLADRIKFSAVSDAKRLRSFHDELFAVYAELFRSQNNAAQRMKELWFYLIRLFDGGDHLGKQILKSKTAQDYILSVNRVFSELPIKNKSLGGW